MSTIVPSEVGDDGASSSTPPLPPPQPLSARLGYMDDEPPIDVSSPLKKKSLQVNCHSGGSVARTADDDDAALPDRVGPRSRATSAYREEEEFPGGGIDDDDDDGAADGRENAAVVFLAATGSLASAALPYALLAAATTYPNIFGLLYLSALVLAFNFPIVDESPRSRRWWGLDYQIRLPLVALVLTGLTALCGIATLIAHQSLCRFNKTFLVDNDDYWELFGFSAECVNDAVVRANWAHVTLLPAALCATFYGKSLSTRRRNTFLWPTTLTPNAWIHWTFRIVPCEWAITVICCVIASFRRCLLTLPLLLFFAYFVGRYCLTRHEVTTRVSLRGLRLFSFFGSVLLYAYFTCFVYNAWQSRRDAPSESQWKWLQGLITAFHEPILDDQLHFCLVGFFLNVTCVAVVSRFRRFSYLAPLLEDGASSDAAPISRPELVELHEVDDRLEREATPPPLLLLYVFKARAVINVGILFAMANVAGSCFGILWSLLWVWSVALPPSTAFSRCVVGCGVFHIVLVFIGGFENIYHDHESLLRIIGLKSANASDAWLAATVVLTMSFNMFFVVFRKRVMRAEAIANAQPVPTAIDSERADLGDAVSHLLSGLGGQRSRSASTAAKGERDSFAERVDPELRASRLSRARTNSSFVSIGEGARPNDVDSVPSRRLLDRGLSGFYRLRDLLVFGAQRYFYVVAFFALFLAAVVQVNVLHSVFLLLFTIIVLRRRFPQILWFVLVFYTLAITHAMYMVIVLRPHDAANLETAGFASPSSTTWSLWPYYIWSAVFLFQLRVVRSTNSNNPVGDATQRRSLAQYLDMVEKISASAIVVANMAFFLMIATTQQASLFGFVYLLFFLSTSAFVLLTSFHSPPTTLRLYWYFVVAAVSVMVFCVYVYQLSPEFAERIMNSIFTPLRTETVGITFYSHAQRQSFFALWPKLVSLMLCIVQSRQWRAAAHGNGDADGTRIASTASATTSDGVVPRFIRLVQFLGNALLRVVVVYSQLLAVTFLFAASVFRLTLNRENVSLIQCTFFLAGCACSVSRRVRSSTTFWYIIQTYALVLSATQYVLQIPFWPADTRSNPWLTYTGLDVETNTDMMWFTLFPTVIVFVTAAIHANAHGQLRWIQRRRRDTIIGGGGGNAGANFSAMSLPDETTLLISTRGYGTVLDVTAGTKDTHATENHLSSQHSSPAPAAAARHPPRAHATRSVRALLGTAGASVSRTIGDVYKRVINPADSFRLAGFHLALGSMFVTSVVLSATFLGPLYLAMTITTAYFGRDEMLRGYRWTVVGIVTFAAMVFQYVLLLPMPPSTSSSVSTPHALDRYFALSPVPADVAFCIMTWGFVAIEQVALSAHSSYRFPYGRTDEITTLSMTERLERFHSRIQVARAHNAVAVLGRLLPPPPGKTDFTKADTLEAKLWTQVYLYGPIVVLTVTAVHAIYDATSSLVVAKLISLVITLVYFQNSRALTWRGNMWWCWIVRYHVAWMALRLGYFIPRVQCNESAACAFVIIGVIPDTSMMRHVDRSCEFSCVTHRYSVGDLVFHCVVISLLWLQSVNFHRNEYAFVLHHRHRIDVESRLLGKELRQTRRLAIRLRKLSDREYVQKQLFVIAQEIDASTSGAVSARRENVVQQDPSRRQLTSDDFLVGAATKGSGLLVLDNVELLQTVSNGSGLADTAPGEQHTETAPQSARGTATNRRSVRQLCRSQARNSVRTKRSNAVEDLLAATIHSVDARTVGLLAGIEGGVLSSSTDSSEDDTDGKGGVPVVRQVPDRFASTRPPPIDTQHGVLPTPREPELRRQDEEMAEVSPTGSPLPARRKRSGLVSVDRVTFADDTAAPTREGTHDVDPYNQHLPSGATSRAASTAFTAGPTATDELVTKDVVNDEHGDGGARSGFEQVRKQWLNVVDAVILWLDRRSLNYGESPRLRKRMIRDRFFLFFSCLYRFILSYTDRVCFAMFSIQFLLAPCILTSVLPVSVFAYAVPMNPRPHRGYWTLSLVYLQLLVVIKSVIKVGFCPSDTSTAALMATRGSHNSDIINLWHGRTCLHDFYLIDALMELLCVLCVLLHTHHLRRWGLWDDADIDVPVDAPVPRESLHDADADADEIESRMAAARGEAAISRSTAQVIYMKLRSAVVNVLRTDVKTGSDLYRFAFACELVSFIYIFFAYYRLSGSSDTLVDSLRHSILPGGLSVTLIVLFLFMVFDRVVYLLRSTVVKYIINTLFAVFYHAVVIWWFGDQCRFVLTFYHDTSFGIRGALAVGCAIYVFKCVYLFLGGVQVSRGMPEYTKHIVFAGSYSAVEFYLYYFSRLVPFVFDLRVILDWTVSKTSLKLPYWIKMEDVCHELYLLQCDKVDTATIEKMNGHDSRRQYPAIFKYPIGIVFFTLLTVILMFPLLLYSSFSPVLQSNSVVTLSTTVSIEGAPPIWESTNRIIEGATTFDRLNGALNGTVTNLLERTRPSLVGLGFSTDTVQLLTMNNYSNTLWSISPPAKQILLDNLNGSQPLNLIVDVQIRSSASGVESSNSFLTQQRTLMPVDRGNMSLLLRGNVSSIRIPMMYSPFLFNRPQNDFTYLNSFGSNNKIDCFLGASDDATATNAIYFSLWCRTLFRRSNPSVSRPWNDLSPEEEACVTSNACPDYEVGSQGDFATAPMYFVVLSVSVLSASFLQSIGLVAAYTTFVFAVGRVLRFAVSGGAFRTTLEDLHDPQFLVDVIELMFIARATDQFDLERRAYQTLVDTLRVSEELQRRTAKDKDD